MKNKVITAVILAALSAFAVGRAVAQQDQSQPGTGGMMGRGQMVGQMVTHHQQMTGLMTKLMDSMKAIESEKDPAALKQKLAEHRALLDQMRAQMMQQGGMMQQMQQMMGNVGQPASPK